MHCTQLFIVSIFNNEVWISFISHCILYCHYFFVGKKLSRLFFTCTVTPDFKYNFVLSYLILSYLILNFILNLISSHLISSHLISSHLISSHLISSHLISSHLISSHLISSHLISSHLILSYLILSSPSGLGGRETALETGGLQKRDGHRTHPPPYLASRTGPHERVRRLPLTSPPASHSVSHSSSTAIELSPLFTHVS